MSRITVRRGLAIIVMPLIAVFFVASLILFQGASNASAGAPTCTWTGGGGSGSTNFSVAANWTCDTGTIPANGTSLIFPVNVTNRTAVNDLASSIVFSGVQFYGTCSGGYGTSAYTLNGIIYLSGPITDTTGAQCIANTNIASLNLKGNSSFVQGTYPNIGINNLAISTFSFSIDGSAAQSVGSVGNLSILNSSSSALTGSGTINVTNSSVVIFAGTSTSSFSGIFNISNGELDANKADTGTTTWALGTSTIKIGDNSGFHITLPQAGLTAMTITNPIQVSGVAGITANTNGDESARIGVQWGSSEENDISGIIGSGYSSFRNQNEAGKTFTFSGAVALTSSLTVLSNAATTFTGALTGSGKTITSYVTTEPQYGEYGTLTVSGSSNTTSTANAAYPETTLRTTTLVGNDCQEGLASSGINPIYIGNLSKVINNGTCGNILVRFGGILAGTGTVGAITTQSSIVDPNSGTAPGILNSGSVSFDSTSTMNAEIGGATSGQYSELNVTGTVTLGSATLSVSQFNSYAPVLGAVYTIINNDGSDAVSGTFASLAQNGKTTVGGYTYKISYIGGTGNDVTLTVTGTPGAPDTSGAISNPVNIAIALGVIAAGIAILIVRTKYLKTVRR